MTHRLLYCKMHDHVLHGLRPAGPHFTRTHGELVDQSFDKIATAEKLGILLDLGVCPYFKLPLGGHAFRVAQIDRDLRETMNNPDVAEEL